jgi:hypothetical protein
MTQEITKIRQTNHSKQATHAGLHINHADLHVKRCFNLGRKPGTRLCLDGSLRASDLMRCPLPWHVEPAGAVNRLSSNNHSVDNILLLIVLINPLLVTFSVLKDIFNYVVTL